MGRAKRTIPQRMPEKLKAIRSELSYTLEEMVVRLEAKLAEMDYPDISLYSGNIHEYEKGAREPLLPVLLAYARIADVSVDLLIDDNLDLKKIADKKINSKK